MTSLYGTVMPRNAPSRERAGLRLGQSIGLATGWVSSMSAPFGKSPESFGSLARPLGYRLLAIGHALSATPQSPLLRFAVLSTLPASTRSLRLSHSPSLVRRYALLPGHVCSQAEIRSRR
jgi:hypothetical protein